MYCIPEQLAHTGLSGALGALATMSVFLVYSYRSRICIKCNQPFFTRYLHKGVMSYYCGGCSKPVHPIKFWIGFVASVGVGLWIGLNIRGMI